MKRIYTLLALLTVVLAKQPGHAATNGTGARDFIGHEISFRDDRWDTSQWMPLDSGFYVRDAQRNPLNYTYFNYSGGAWVPAYTNADSFDTHGNQLVGVRQLWNAGSSSFVNSSKNIDTYNAANLALTQMSQVWINNNWRNSQLYTYAYNAHNRITQYLIQLWDTTTNTWLNSSEELETYDPSNNLLTDCYVIWDSGTHAWDTTTLDTYTYDANNNQLTRVNASYSMGVINSAGKYINTYSGNNRISSVYQDSYDGITWANYSRDGYKFDAYNYPLVDTATVWNTGSSTWDNFSMSYYVYNAAHQQTSYEQALWQNGAFVFSGGTWKGYDSYGNNTLYEAVSWSSTQGWYVTTKDSDVYAANGDLLLGLGYSYDTIAHVFNQTRRSTFWYDNAGIGQLPAPLDATLFPNPTNNGKDLALHFNLQQDANLAINIYDMAGHLVHTENRFVTTSQILPLACPTLSAGTYLLQILDRDTGKNSTLKFVVK